MIRKDVLQERVSTRRQELEAETETLTALRSKVSAFVEDIKGRSAIYALVKNLKIWKELAALIESDDSGTAG